MSRVITASQLRSSYLDFFARRGHAVIPSASLVPAVDSGVLFTTAGMHPLIPYLLGEPHPAGRRLVDVQKCARTGDIEAVGDDTHLTFFEMLGNWSLGDYSRPEAIAWSFEFLTADRWLGLPLDRLGVTCFGGDERVPADRESASIWAGLGIPPQRIALLGREDNWWGPAGPTGPCGPDTEIFYWIGADPPPSRIDVGDHRWVEIWNNVFMEHTQISPTEMVPLARANVDTGMGVERTLAALNGLSSVYQVDTVKPLADRLRALVVAQPADERKLRVVTDHLRAACFLISDGVRPSNKDRGYVVRRLLRRCILFSSQLGLPPGWYEPAIATVQDQLGGCYPQLIRDTALLRDTIAGEITRFERTLARGLRVLEKRETLDGKVAFDLFQTYGFPFELTQEVALASGKTIDQEGFRAELERHRQRSRQGTLR
jgi:alanyl-tRNA synthetase